MPQHGGDLARFYTVTEPRRHDKGHTVYKVTARIVSRKNPEKVEEIVVWKRYNDIKKLHKELCMIHRNLFRRSEEFPPFAKATVFGRFEDSVIEERRQCAEDLLQFSANIPSLYNSRQLQEFFEGGDKHEGSDIIGPADSPTDSFSDSLHQGPEDWLQDKVPLSSHAREDGGDRDEETESVDTLPDLPDILLTSPAPGAAIGTGSGCSGLDVCGPATGGGVSEAAADILLPNLPSTAGEMEPPASPFSSPLSPDGVPGDDQADDWPDGAGAGRPAMGRQDSLFSLSTAGRGKDDYLVVASQQIHLALAQEVLGNYQGAFDAYKMGVDLLLQGVQGDTNTVRRDMVKRKTAQYLLHAEEIYTSHLQALPETGAMAQADRGLSFGPPNLCASPLEELKKFRVLGVIGKVLLVLDPKSGETFVMKGLRKSSQMSQIQKTVVVRSVPFLVHLIRYFSTEDSIFLLLRYATGGRLWSNVSGFLNRSPEESVEYAREAEADGTDSSRDSDGQRAGVAALLVPQVATSSPASSSEPPQAPLADITEISKGSSYDDGSTSEDGDEEEDEELDDPEVKGDDRSLSTDSGEREYSNSYLSLFQEYQQEAEQRVTEEVAQPVNAFSAAMDGADSNSQCQEMSGQSMSHLSSDSLCSPATLQEHVFFPAEGMSDVFAEPPRSGDHLRDSKSSPMELFRIDSGDSGGDFPFVDRVDSSERMSAAQAADGRDTSDTIEDVVAQNERMMKRMHDELDVCVDAGVSDDKSDSASEVIPIISFREAAEEDTFSHGSGRSDVGTFYAKPRPGSAASGAQEVIGTPDLFATDSTLLCVTDGVEQSEQEDRHSGMIAVCGESDAHATNEIESKEDSNGVVSSADVALGAAVEATTEVSRTNDKVRVEADSDLGTVVDSVREGDKRLESNSHDHSTKTNVDNGNATFGDVYTSQGLLESAATMAMAAMALPWVDATRAEAEAIATAPTATCPESLPVSEVRRHAEDEDDGDDDVDTSTVAATRARDVSQVFRELEEARSRATECRTCLPEGCVRQWAAEMVMAVDGLHQHGLICRDLNPSNILLDDRGHILLTYFGQWSEVDWSCSSLAQEQFYCAPEVGGIAEETEACDWWSLGAIMFELLTGQALHVCHPTGITTHTTLHLPEHLSPEAASLLRQLLQFNAWERLGVEEIRAHPFFSTVQWGRLAGH